MIEHHKFYRFLQRQIPLMIGLSLGPGLAYLFLGSLVGRLVPAMLWYGAMVVLSIWGWHLYHHFQLRKLGRESLHRWYRQLSYFFYIFFFLWTVIFLLFSQEERYHVYYIAVFTQIGASVVASALLVSDKRLFVPILAVLMVPLIVYFAAIGTWYGYILSVFSTIFWGVLFYSSVNSYNLLVQNSYQAQHDALTGLYNRRYFVETIEKLTERLRFADKRVYLLLIDLDHFKTINDTLGHDIGDKVLVEVATRLRQCCDRHFVIARLGGDEFTIISDEFAPYDTWYEDAVAFARKLLQTLKEPYYIDGHHLYLSASIGINMMGAKVTDASRFIKEADIAMYEAKSQGRDGIIVFDEALANRVEYRLEVERRLYFALENEEIVLRYQPQYNRNRQIVGCEVLMRWFNPEFGFISPSEFVTVAEKTGLIIELGKYILQEAFKTLRDWHRNGVRLEQFSVNISVRQFFDTRFIDDVETMMTRYLPEETRRCIVFEITETVSIEDKQRVIETMERFKKMGIRFSMDDFGTGYSSLSTLREIPIDELKIDRSFVARIGEKASDEQMITTVLSIAKIFDLVTVAEGVESEQQYQFMLKHGCELFQGYYFAKPLEKDAFEALWHEKKQHVAAATMMFEI